ncbi:hypothetical protein Pla144_09960 [Bythopirellula polymerisocia]|uniref:Uncharacterized protein n=1 Tax=Bythopirellula polymerisocia TaxID=2528003 RepID=A0A5C6D026_9BACT|nr:hypothetical protein Pla144_09960 [Bythopirellula polymerisocia]
MREEFSAFNNVAAMTHLKACVTRLKDSRPRGRYASGIAVAAAEIGDRNSPPNYACLAQGCPTKFALIWCGDNTEQKATVLDIACERHGASRR